MKKILLTAAILAVSSLAIAEEKTATFALSSADTWGVTAPEANKGTDLASSTKKAVSVTANDITLTFDMGTATTNIRLWNTSGVITCRTYGGSTMAFSAKGYAIKKITFEANKGATNFKYTTETGTLAYPDWTGSASSVTFSASAGSQLISATVTYEENQSEGGTEGGVEQYVAANIDGPSVEFAQATVDSGLSVINFGTDHLKAVAVGGATPKDVLEETENTFPGWKEWNEITWSYSNRNLNDAKTMYFYWINGKGNPFTELNAKRVTGEKDGVTTITWVGDYKLYVPDGSNGLPISGLYYKFTPSVDGKLRMKIWANKGNRNTFVVDDETKQPIEFDAEGYVNGQSEADPDNEGKNMMKFLSAEEIQTLHDNAKLKYDTTFTDETKQTISKIDTIDTAPYVIGAGNQPFFGWAVIQVKANKTYWLFQDSSQIGFGGFDFAYGSAELPDYQKSEGTGIEEMKANNSKKGETFDLSGRRVTKMQQGHIYLQSGKKLIVR